MQQSKKYFLLILLIAVLVTPQFVLAAWWNPLSWDMWNSLFHKPQTQIACPMIAKLCPDGSSVSPKGPKCEFPACPAQNLLNDAYPLFPNLIWGTASQITVDSPAALSGYSTSVRTEIKDKAGDYDFFGFYDKKLKNAGWTEATNLEADGVLGRQVGYMKDKNYIILSDKIAPEKITSSTNEPLQFTYPYYVTYTIFTGTITDNANETGRKTYTNSTYNYQLNYPSDATIKPENFGAVTITYKTGFIDICMAGQAACGNFPGVGSDEATLVKRNVTIEGTNRTMSGFIMKATGDEGMGISLPNNIFIYLTISGQHSGDAQGVESTLLETISSLKFITPTTDTKEQGCINSGGKITTIDCYCGSGTDLMNNCAIGGCACNPSGGVDKKIKSCECGQGECFDGNKCVAFKP